MVFLKEIGDGPDDNAERISMKEEEDRKEGFGAD